MSQKSKGAMNLEEAGYPASEYQALSRFLRRLMLATHPNQIESMLAYANSIPDNRSITDAATMLSKATGISTTRRLLRMSGNSLPNSEDRDTVFAAALAGVKQDILVKLRQDDLVKSVDCQYRVRGKTVYRGHTRVAICLTSQHAVAIAAALTLADEKKPK